MTLTSSDFSVPKEAATSDLSVATYHQIQTEWFGNRPTRAQGGKKQTACWVLYPTNLTEFWGDQNIL